MAELKTTIAVAPQGAALLNTQKLTAAKDAATAQAGPVDTFANPSGRTILVLVGGAAAASVYLHALGKPGGLGLKPQEIKLGIGQYWVVGPFDPPVYNNASNAVGLATTAADIAAMLIQIQ